MILRCLFLILRSKVPHRVLEVFYRSNLTMSAVLSVWYPIDCRSFLDIYWKWHGFNNVCSVQNKIIILNSYLRFVRQLLSAVVSVHWLEELPLFLHAYKYHIRTRQVLLQTCSDCQENVCLNSSFSKKGGRSYKNNT